MLTAIAIDDEPQALDVVQLHAAKVPFLQLEASFTNAFEAISYLQANKVDLIFLDIKMPDISGIEFITCLSQVPMIIFTTAYSQYAVKGFELNAIDYLLKPFSLVRFTKACNKALEHKQLRSKEPENYIFIKTGYEEEKVWLADICYVEAEGNYLTFMLKDKQLLSRQTMTDIVKVLPPEKFIRIHRSYTIAIDKIEKLTRQEVTVAGKTIPVGVSYEEKLEEIKSKLIKR
ncbi:LytTR family DNA-binding domain-containing protein [Rhodocytophaga aerolata]|uniref:LytTR family DNA-binding domain-containing protein n=1 Tax=Rhodocytophaga aerolata TaxID=455078 RepID=A0ABT8R0U7_9BACT|nr:LytTR family DNA-binding domain-containing protein [Rhodocytophaga aerolata]MDO1445712.1 LytTR family DNA-binding domain-containing protein [Rhodocytophaga aerolata]